MASYVVMAYVSYGLYLHAEDTCRRQSSTRGIGMLARARAGARQRSSLRHDDLFLATFRRMPTANAEGSIGFGGCRWRDLGEARLGGTFGSTRVFGVRRRHAPKGCQK